MDPPPSQDLDFPRGIQRQGAASCSPWEPLAHGGVALIGLHAPGGKVMPNSISAEPMGGTPCELAEDAEDDRALAQQEKQTGSATQPQLRIVYSADRVQDPLLVDMPPPDRPRPASDRKPAM